MERRGVFVGDGERAERVGSCAAGVVPAHADAGGAGEIAITVVDEKEFDGAVGGELSLGAQTGGGSLAAHGGGEGGPGPVELIAGDGEAIPDEAAERGGTIRGERVDEGGELGGVGADFADDEIFTPLGARAFGGEGGEAAGGIEGERVAVSRQGDAEGEADEGGAFDGEAGGGGIAEGKWSIGAGWTGERVNLEHEAGGGAGERGKFAGTQPRGQRGKGERHGGDGGAQRVEPGAVAGEFPSGGVEIDLEFGDGRAVHSGLGEEFAGERGEGAGGGVGAREGAGVGVEAESETEVRGGAQGGPVERDAGDLRGEVGGGFLPGNFGGENDDRTEGVGVGADTLAHGGRVGALPEVAIVGERAGRADGSAAAAG